MHLQKGNVRLERIFTTVLFVGLIGVFIYKMLRIAEVSERMMIESHTTQLKAALELRFAELMMSGKQHTAIELVETNPMLLYEKMYPQQIFEGYVGEQWEVEFDKLDDGSWVFDKKTGTLMYKLRHNHIVTNLDPEPAKLQWHIKASVIVENNLSGKGKRERVESLKLVPVYKFEWNY